MTNKQRPGGALKRLLGSSLLAGIGVIVASPAERAEDVPADEVHPEDGLEDDGRAAGVKGDGQALAILFQHMSTFDATQAAATAALSSDVRVRYALAEAMGCRFRLVGDDFVIDQLARDPDEEVRAAAAHAARVRGLG